MFSWHENVVLFGYGLQIRHWYEKGFNMDERLKIKRRVLIVEDEPINMRMLKNIVGDNYEVLLARDGREAMNIIQENSEKLSLVLLDLIIPEINGYEILKFMHADKVLKQIPVIVCTAEIDSEVSCLQMGAVDFIAKPYNHPKVIQARIERTIELSEGTELILATKNDSLTGLLTNDFFMEYASFRDQYYPQSGMDAVVFNINRFHIINELQGRDMGNDVLVRIAKAIKQIAEKKSGIAGRGGADEFLLYIPHEDEPLNILEAVSDKLVDILTNSRVYVRMGIYPDVDKSLKIEDRFDRARHACNSIRGNYNVQYAVYDKEMHQMEAFHDTLVNNMEKGLENGEFIVYYQPKYYIQGSRDMLYSAEALIRWNHPEFGMIRPVDFVPLFQENGLVHKLDHFVWNEVARQIGEWMIRYDIKLPVSVNVSRVDMGASDLDEEIFALVQNNWITPDLLHLEVTESAYTGDSDQIINVVQSLRDRGFEIEMDDFRTGYSSLNMISSLPIDVLKLDMEFIKSIHLNNKELRLVELMMDIARFIKVKVVAEGVENKEQYELLKKTGCDIVQGYYFSRPVPPAEFEKLIEKEIAMREKEYNS